MRYTSTAPSSIKKLFNSIAPHYDRANFVLSCGLYRRWNHRLIQELHKNGGTHLLDLCAGTGEIAFGFLKKKREAQATLLDFSSEMLEVAKSKGEPFKTRFESVTADAQKIPFPDHSFDAVSIAYGLRNVQNTKLCMKEAYRVLHHSGVFAILELTCPSFPIFRSLHSLFLKTMIPWIGKRVAYNQEAYQYLCDSIQHFIAPQKIEEALLDAGFCSTKRISLMGGIATVILAKK